MVDPISTSLAASALPPPAADLTPLAPSTAQPGAHTSTFTVPPPQVDGSSVGSAAPAGTASTVDALNRPFERLDAMRAQMSELLEGIKTQDLSTLTSDERSAAHVKNNFKLLELQLGMGEIAFQIEMISKVAEQGTSGARQVLQTQT